ncbi:MAG: PEP-CTERM sorting domain-containing protein [Deltaproteobacteria bacterium]|nr:PEP-CTERM sorting domain-containing protein [Deltaproteobacteria bacterium]
MRTLLHAATMLAVLTLGLAAPAQASYLLTPDPISFTASDGSEGLIHFYGHDVGLPLGATVLAGSIGAADDVLMFTIEMTVVTGEALKKVIVEIDGLPSTGAGTILSGDVKGKKAKADGDGWKIDLDALDSVGQVTDPLLISYASIPTGSQIDFLLDFMNSTASAFGILNEEGGVSTQVPEPVSWLLIGLGLLGFSSRRFAGR